MKRREFFWRFGSGAAVAVAAPAGVLLAKPTTPTSDEFVYNGYRVKWRDFIAPINRGVMCGVWLAKHTTIDQEWVSTTLGQCYATRAWEGLDMTRADGWPLVTVFSTDRERAVVKERARTALLRQLDQRCAEWASA